MSLMPFQEKAIAWLSQRPTAFLALEQGLGKTVVASCDLVAPAIVVCPASMKWTWHKELTLWRPDLKVQVIRKAKDQIQPADVHIINYDIIDRVELPGHYTLIADESHYAKNHKAKRTKHLITLIRAAKQVRLLSGTPIVNRPIELWPLLYAAKATKLGYFEFGMRYCAGWKTPWDTYDFSGASRMDELYDLLNPVMLRLTKAQVLPELPEKTFRVVELDLPVDKREKAFNIEDITRNPEPIAFEAMPDILHMNAKRKLPMAIQHIKDALESTEKVVVFAHHTDIVGELLSGLADHNPVRVVGADSPEARQAAVDRFQTDPACRVFVGNIKAAGVGLTLTAASRVIFVECSWSPADVMQCADRCHRIGQKNPVLVEILTIHQSIDAAILHAVLGKLEIINLIIKETSMSTLNNAAIAAKFRELADLFDPTSASVAPDPKPVAAQKAASSQATAEAGAVPSKTATAKTPTTESVEEKPQASTAATDGNANVASSEPEVTTAPAASSNISIEHVREGLAKLIDAGKRTEALQILKDHGAAKVGELQADKFALVSAAINKALA